MAVSLSALETFVKVAELASFTRAADHLGAPKARISWQIKKLEAELGVTLLSRSTRRVSLTQEGESLLGRARRLTADAEELFSLFEPGRSVRGRVRIDLPINLGREVVIPRLPELLARHPELELAVSTTDRFVQAFHEGFDCVLRVGAPSDGGLVGRKLGSMRMMNCASPGYLHTHGVPHRIEDLARHYIVHYSSSLSVQAPAFEYPTAQGYREISMRSLLTVNSTDAYHAACLAGLGIIQVPRAGMLKSLAAGLLVEVMPEYVCAPMPVTLLHTHGRNVPRRVRAVMSWLTEQLAPYFEAQDKA